MIRNGVWYGSYVEDSGWQEVELTDNFQPYNDNTHPVYRKIGNIVHVEGSVSPVEELSSSTTRHIIGTLPEGYRPNMRITIKGSSDNLAVWMGDVAPDGCINCSRYTKTGSSFDAFPKGAWLSFNFIFIVD